MARAWRSCPMGAWPRWRNRSKKIWFCSIRPRAKAICTCSRRDELRSCVPGACLRHARLRAQMWLQQGCGGAERRRSIPRWLRPSPPMRWGRRMCWASRMPGPYSSEGSRARCQATGGKFGASFLVAADLGCFRGLSRGAGKDAFTGLAEMRPKKICRRAFAAIC